MKKPIGVFDSGIGGLTVVHELIRHLPHEQIVYFGDTARVPYGGKSTEAIQGFADEITKFLLSKDVKLVVVACNTASATSLEWLRTRYPIPIVGVIGAGARRAVKATRNNVIGVIGTRATIESRAYITAIHRIHPGMKVHSKSCPLLVPFAEERADQKIVELVLTRYLLSLQRKSIDTLILGCTHYPLLKNAIQEVVGEDVKLIDSASVIAREVKTILKTRDIQSKTGIPQHSFYFSDKPRGFKQLSERFLGHSISYTKISLQ